jgi:hypothetical protein
MTYLSVHLYSLVPLSLRFSLDCACLLSKSQQSLECHGCSSLCELEELDSAVQQRGVERRRCFLAFRVSAKQRGGAYSEINGKRICWRYARQSSFPVFPVLDNVNNIIRDHFLRSYDVAVYRLSNCQQLSVLQLPVNLMQCSRFMVVSHWWIAQTVCR